MPRQAPKHEKPRFGVGEWFGRMAAELSPLERRELYQLAQTPTPDIACPFRQPSHQGSPLPCSKKGGVCSLKLYEPAGEGGSRPVRGDSGALRCTCPYRFQEGGIVESWIGEVLLGSSAPLSVSEVSFLESTLEGDDDRTSFVGRIDQVLVHPDSVPLRWCAVEVQAVYFSGPELKPELARMSEWDVAGLPFPGRIRRPDYRSSGPKRLMPQLQIKVPTLRRWGKKLAVVVDESFMAALGQMDSVGSVSNCDVAWFVVRFREEERRALLEPLRVQLTTLERAVEGLTAGVPVSLEDFESSLSAKLTGRRVP